MKVGTSQSVAILHYAAPPIVGGVELTIYHHARLLTQAGFHVLVIAGRGDDFHPDVDFCRIPEVDSRHPDVLSIGKALAQGEVHPEFTNLRNRLVTQLRPLLSNVDVVIVHNAVTLHKNLSLTAALHDLAREGTSRLIAWCHDFAWQDALYTPDLHPGYPWDLIRTPWPQVMYVVVSEDRRKELANLMGLKEREIRVIHPGVDEAQILKLESATHSLIEKLHLLEADPLMLLPARITRRKNIEFAVRVTASLKREKPQTTLLVTGPPGPHNPTNIAYLKRLQELREKLGVKDRVHFLYEFGEDGKPLYVTDNMMADLYHLSDLLFFPSRREGFGIPPLEAALMRLPIFASNIPPVRESTDGCAHYFDPLGDPDAVASSIFDYLKDDQVYHLRKHVSRGFHWETIVRQQLIPLIHKGR